MKTILWHNYLSTEGQGLPIECQHQVHLSEERGEHLSRQNRDDVWSTK